MISWSFRPMPATYITSPAFRGWKRTTGCENVLGRSNLDILFSLRGKRYILPRYLIAHSSHLSPLSKQQKSDLNAAQTRPNLHPSISLPQTHPPVQHPILQAPPTLELTFRTKPHDHTAPLLNPALVLGTSFVDHGPRWRRRWGRCAVGGTPASDPTFVVGAAVDGGAGDEVAWVEWGGEGEEGGGEEEKEGGGVHC